MQRLSKRDFLAKAVSCSGCETVWNDVGGNRTGLAEMNAGLRNHGEHVNEEPRE